MENEQRLSPGDIMELHPNFHFRWEEPQKAYVLLYPEGIVKLNNSAAEVLEVCARGDRSIAEGSALLASRYEHPKIETEIMKFMELAYAKGWIRPKS
ncbi:MAG TPA: pyrroloquinoline quinone biosynthesis peptide chaperone PqqD [Hyphomicrobiaceae bacterium]|nr:pyrroloquinoline quinone biosynthesis peptide chaperone PqqD [Hyphomicrobiaceae bacterium]